MIHLDLSKTKTTTTNDAGSIEVLGQVEAMVPESSSEETTGKRLLLSQKLAVAGHEYHTQHPSRQDLQSTQL